MGNAKTLSTPSSATSPVPGSRAHTPIRRGQPLLLITLLVLLASACASPWGAPLHGEQAAYHVFNATDSPVIEMPELFAEDRRTRLYANLQAMRAGSSLITGAAWPQTGRSAIRAPVPQQGHLRFDPFGQPLPGRHVATPAFDADPGDESLDLPRPMAGSFQPAAGPHRIPEEVWLQWRRDAAPGQARYQGTLVGPVRMALRERIPPEVITRLHESWRYRLDIAVGATDDRPTLHWRLLRTSDQGIEVVGRSANDLAY